MTLCSDRGMEARYILGALAVVFLIAGLSRVRRLGLAHPQARTWLLVAVVFALISTWLSIQG